MPSTQKSAKLDPQNLPAEERQIYWDGFGAGRDGRLYDSSNPYLSNGPKYDGADSMGDALLWWEGWCAGRNARTHDQHSDPENFNPLFEKREA